MPFEMSCPHCQGQMMVETLGIVVACPHCGTHLAAPEEIPGTTETESGPASNEQEKTSRDHASPAEESWGSDIHGEESSTSLSEVPAASESAIEGGSNVIVSELETETATDSEVPSAVRVENPDPSGVIPAIVTDTSTSLPEPVSGFPILDEPAPKNPKVPEEKTSADVEELPSLQETPANEETAPAGDFPNLNGEAGSGDSGTMPVIITDTADPADTEAEHDFPALEPAPEEVSAETFSPPTADEPMETAADAAVLEMDSTKSGSVYDSVYSRRGKIVPNPVFQVWVSYTILLTGALALAIYHIFTATTSKLENLPDVKPRQNKSGQVERRLISEDATMPPGHTLALNTTQRFGNIEVTPLKVTRGDLEFVHYADPSKSKPAEGPVVKLWLKFKNVSRDQTIAPLDNDLLYFRDIRGDRKAGAWSNNFVCPVDQKTKQGDIVLIYDHLVTGDYDIKDQNLETALQPGEEVTIFIPTQEGRLDQLTGDLIWRVHFRKGYSPKNYGVTTVFEVKFSSNAIRPESSSA